MKIHSIILAFAIITIVFFSGCSDDKEEKKITPPPINNDTPTMRVDTSAISLIAAPETVRFLIRKDG